MNTPPTPQSPGQWKHLERNPKSAYKQLFINGTRIRAEVVYRLAVGPEPKTPEEIAADYNLPVEAVKEAIAYCARSRQKLTRTSGQRNG